jgi:hypothetical protein
MNIYPYMCIYTGAQIHRNENENEKSVHICEHIHIFTYMYTYVLLQSLTYINIYLHMFL